MISQDKKRGIKELEIFDNFEVDKNLPKYHSENGGQAVGQHRAQFLPLDPTPGWRGLGGRDAENRQPGPAQPSPARRQRRAPAAHTGMRAAN